MSLEQELNLVELSLVDMAYNEPTSYRLKQVPKSQQNYELLKFVISNVGEALRHASKQLITDELCRIAVKKNGLALQYVPSTFITNELCDLAVSENGLALKFVPENICNDVLVKKAVCFYYTYEYKGYEKIKVQGGKLGEYNKYPIAYVPSRLINPALLFDAVKYSPHCLRDIPTKDISYELLITAVSMDGTVLSYVPKKMINKEIIEIALANNSLALEFVAKNRLNKEICLACLAREPMAIKYVPYKYLDYKNCKEAFDKKAIIFKFIPDEYKTIEMCLEIVKKEFFWISNSDAEKISFDDIPYRMRNNQEIIDTIISRYIRGASLLLEWNDKKNVDDNNKTEELLSEEIVDYLKLKKEDEIIVLKEMQEPSLVERKILELSKLNIESLVTPVVKADINVLPDCCESIFTFHSFSKDDSAAKVFYYISDIHLEHQFKEVIKSSIQDKRMIFSEIMQFLNAKIQEMVSTAENNEDTILIGGDISHCQELTILFYKTLKKYWKGDVIAVLGNHELWDGNIDTVSDDNIRTVDEIVNEYKEMVSDEERLLSGLYNTYFLQNDVYIVYKNKPFGGKRLIREEQILNASIEELTQLFNKASTIVLGGVGFSGLNPQYNAEKGLYRSTIVSLEADKELSKRFCKIYEIIKKCAGNKQVIVLTHMPIFDWTNEPCNPNWIYVNGHTHHNQMEIEENGAVILSDNQIGYNPQKWKLNSFSSFGWYDPFESYQDGFYKINSEQYKDFNIGRGINSNGCNYQGQIYMLKRDGLYMFLLDTTKSLYLLDGGRRKKLEQLDVKYYYDNMEKYGKSVRDAIRPFQQFLEAISKEVKCFGGSGKIHGCIVDISWFSHIYVNPFDGKVTPYWATDICSRMAYDNLQLLLEERESDLVDNFMLQCREKTLPIINQYIMNNSNAKGAEIAIVPRQVLGTEMYAPSKVIKTIQYIWSQNVIRVWNEDVLSPKENNKIEKKS